ncbi:hypothetical protein [endosymbiont of Lamellibrachia barhami]|uniref:hypothetical protein n=1 Tax=endosymbiont of Lamellibrachia barhami TaxID=205975 RepID=UPI0015AD6342|nr:hypothetical protein [endosymbiont of Lamellibrachia barhami]
MKNDYVPIACLLHEQFEYAVLKRAWLELVWRDEMGLELHGKLRPTDVYTQAGAEYLQGVTELDERVKIRLDLIGEARWSDSGEAFEGWDRSACRKPDSQE